MDTIKCLKLKFWQPGIPTLLSEGFILYTTENPALPNDVLTINLETAVRVNISSGNKKHNGRLRAKFSNS